MIELSTRLLQSITKVHRNLENKEYTLKNTYNFVTFFSGPSKGRGLRISKRQAFLFLHKIIML